MSWRRALSLVSVPVLLAAAGCAQDTASPGASDGATGAAKAAQCAYPAAGQPAKPVDPPSTDSVAHSGAASVTLTLDGAPVTITLDRENAPCTSNSIESLAKQGWFTDTSCHRLTNEGIFVLQCGDPSGTGKGGPGYSFADELATAAKLPEAGTTPDGKKMVTYPKGTVAMANAGPGTNGSQFFLVWQDSPLEPNYTVFGKLDEASLTQVGRIAAEGVAANNIAPNAPAKITDVKLG